jgi:hypothetical protein
MKNMVYECKLNRREELFTEFSMLKDARMALMFLLRFKLS